MIWNKEFRKIEISVPLVSLLVKEIEIENRSNCLPPKSFENPCKKGGDRYPQIPRNRTKVYTTCHHGHRFERPPSISPVQNILSPLIDPHVRTSRYQRDLSPHPPLFPSKSASISQRYIPTSHTHSIHDYARDRRESNDDTIPIGSKQRSITEPRYDRALSRELGLEASLNYAAVASNLLSLSLSLQVFLGLSLSLLSLEARTPRGHGDGGFCYSRKLVYPLLSRNGNRGQVYFSPCLITGKHRRRKLACWLPLLESLDLRTGGGRTDGINRSTSQFVEVGGSKVANSELGRLTDSLMSRDRVTHSRGIGDL